MVCENVAIVGQTRAIQKSLESLDSRLLKKVAGTGLEPMTFGL